MRVVILKEYAKKNFPASPLLDYAIEVEKITTSKVRLASPRERTLPSLIYNDMHAYIILMCIVNLLVAFDFIRKKNEPHDFTLEKLFCLIIYMTGVKSKCWIIPTML